jgi:Cu(I)/Ag(I) efflux system membrane fusion protein
MKRCPVFTGRGAAALLLGAVFAVMAPAAAADEREILYWYDPMHPDVHFDAPGRSPFMDMDLVAKYAGGDADREIVRIRPEMMQNLNIRTATAERGALQREIRSFGSVEYDQQRISHAHARIEGWVERLMVQAVGDRVSPGQALLELYSPPLIAAQEELLEALRGGREPLIRAARERLRTLGMTQALIEEVEQRRSVRRQVPIHAHHGGVVISLGVRHGMYVTPDTEILALADLSTVWVIADLFEHQLDWVRIGDRVEVHLPFRRGESLLGMVEYVYPDLNRQTRTVPVRLRFDNSEGLLKPGMYAGVTIFPEPLPDSLTVPREAVIRTGRTDRIIVHLGEGRFRATEVRLGAVAGERMEILEGLREGEEVVVSGQFLIDSEARVRSAVQRMAAPSHAH